MIFVALLIFAAPILAVIGSVLLILAFFVKSNSPRFFLRITGIIFISPLAVFYTDKISRNLNPEVRNSLFLAIESGDLDRVKQLIPGEYEITYVTKMNPKHTPLTFTSIAYRNGSDASQDELLKIMEYLLQSGCHINIDAMDSKGKSALLYASDYGDTEMVQLLLEYGADVNLKGKKGRSALIEAAATGNDQTISLLLKYGANINDQDSTGNTPLMIASTTCNAVYIDDKALRLLLEKGADLDRQNKAGDTALIVSNDENLEILLQYGADINIQDIKGKTALIKAVINGDVRRVKLLLRYNADKEIEDNQGNTAVDYASSKEAHQSQMLQFF